MNVLELEPLKKKKLELVLVESEFPVEWSLSKPEPEDDEWNLRLTSAGYMKTIDDLIGKHAPKFAVEELGNRNLDAFLYDNPLVDVFKKRGIDHGWVDIDENALGYISASLDPAITLHAGLVSSADSIKASKDTTKRTYLQQVLLTAEYLKSEIESQVDKIRYDIRQAWMMSGILKRAEGIDAIKMTALLICDKRHFDGMTGLADQLGVGVLKVAMKKSVKNLPDAAKIDEFLKSTVLDIAPVKVKEKKADAEKILYMFDTDSFASPFDINMAYDAGFTAVIPFSNVTAEKVTRLVQDAMFSRKPTAPTCFFVGGSNVKECDKIAEKVVKALVPPFEHPVVVDPRGSHTTASAVVAKTLQMAINHGWDGLAGKHVAVYGAGPVGQIAAVIAANEHAHVTMVETWDKASQESIAALVKLLNDEAGQDATPIVAAFAPTEAAREEIAQGTDIIWAVATAGVQVLGKTSMEKLKGLKLVVDINAVPPAGIEGLKAKHEDKDVYPGIFGTGSLALGGLKYVTESNMLKEAANTSGAKVFNYSAAYETAKTILFGKKVILANQ